MGWRVGCDIGGTFIDFVISSNGNIFTGKYLSGSTEEIPNIVLRSFNDLVTKHNLSFKDCDQFLHGTTIASNLVLERKGKGTALITTKGFADVLRLMRQKKADVYDWQMDSPVPLIPRHDIYEVTERIYADGNILTPLDEEEVRRLVRELKKKGVDSVAICFLHSFVNPEHEQKTGMIIRKEAPEMLVTLSSEICPMWREYERSSTAAANAYIMRLLTENLEKIETGLKDIGYKGQLYVMQSAAGLASSATVKRCPVKTLESGPAAGAVLGTHVSRLMNADICLFDMGGTTTKSSLIRGGRSELRSDIEVDRRGLKAASGISLAIPAVDLIEIGAGGGSIARVTSSGTLTVGPDSAGASPGPVCYDLGGTEPTITDAVLVLDYLNADYFSGGKMKLNRPAAVKAIEKNIAKPLGISVPEAANGIFHIANLSMENAIRAVTLERGANPRSFVLLAIGGAAPLCASAIASDLGMNQVCIPSKAGVGSAFGLLLADIKFDLIRTLLLPVEKASIKTINRVFKEMEAEGSNVMCEAGVSSFSTLISADMRYHGQGFEVNVPLPKARFTEDDVSLLKEIFNKAYFQRYTYSNPDMPIEGVNWHMSVVAPAPRIELKIKERGKIAEAYKGKRKAYFEERRDYVECDIYEFSLIPIGIVIDGPAVIEDIDTSIVLRPGNKAKIDEMGNLLISIGA